jgi:hypothetical protein
MPSTGKAVPGFLLSVILYICCSRVHSLPVHLSQAPFQLTRQQIEEYNTNGYVIIPKLLTESQIQSSLQAVVRMKRKRSLATRLMYKVFPSYGNLKFQTWRTNAALEEVAFDSPASSICASLMGLNPQSQPLRLVKDAVLGYQAGDKGCEWHVDDKVFWPCEDGNFGKPNAGINVWITLSSISKKNGGGLALARGSHVKKGWTRKAREVIAERGPITTCQLQALDLESWERMEGLKETHDLQPGDAIFHNRYLFHKGDPFSAESDVRERKGMKHRISLRYMPADATYQRFDMGSSIDPVIDSKGLKTGDALSKGGEYFPQTWPHRLPEEQQKEVLADPELFTFKGIFQMMNKARNQQPEN